MHRIGKSLGSRTTPPQQPDACARQHAGVAYGVIDLARGNRIYLELIAGLSPGRRQPDRLVTHDEGIVEPADVIVDRAGLEQRVVGAVGIAYRKRPCNFIERGSKLVENWSRSSGHDR